MINSFQIVPTHLQIVHLKITFTALFHSPKASMRNSISSYCKIKDSQINLNGEILFSAAPANFEGFSKAAYNHLQLNYLKFFKMDNLCKLALLCSEALLKNKALKKRYAPEDIALIISNSASSLDTDRKHSLSIKDRANYFPSPSVFVYTLPNILVGEICIRNNFKGENSFFIFDKFDADFMATQVKQLLDTSLAKVCITGWVDYDKEQADAFLCLIEKSEDLNQLELTKENFNNLYFK